MEIMLIIQRDDGNIRYLKGDFGSTARIIINHGLRGFVINNRKIFLGRKSILMINDCNGWHMSSNNVYIATALMPLLLSGSATILLKWKSPIILGSSLLSSLQVWVFIYPYVRYMLQGLYPQHHPLYQEKLLRLLIVIVFVLHKEINIFVGE